MEELATTTEVASMLQVSRRKVQRMAKDGLLPVVAKLPGTTGLYLFDRDEVAAMGGE